MEADQSRICIRCAEKNKPHFNFCSKCGADLRKNQFHNAAVQRRSVGWLPIVAASIILSGGYVVTHHSDAIFGRQSEPTARISEPRSTPEIKTTAQSPAPPKHAPLPAAVKSRYWPEDRTWTTIEGWTVFETTEIACFARKTFLGGFTLLLGRMRGSGDFVIGMTGDEIHLPWTGERILELVFDGSRTWHPYFEGSTDLVVGRYASDARLAEEIARSSRLRVLRGIAQLADIPLDGTRAALTEVNACFNAMKTRETGDRQTRDNALPNDRLCENKPSNGELLESRRGVKRQGHKVTIQNSGQGDAIIKIRDEKSRKLAYSFLVHRNKKASVNGISDGEYRIQFAFGDTLLEGCGDYANPAASQFDQSTELDTHVERTKDKIITTTKEYTATLYNVPNGNITISKINPDDFVKE